MSVTQRGGQTLLGTSPRDPKATEGVGGVPVSSSNSRTFGRTQQGPVLEQGELAAESKLLRTHPHKFKNKLLKDHIDLQVTTFENKTQHSLKEENKTQRCSYIMSTMAGIQ